MADGAPAVILRPDPAEYVEDFGIGPVRPMDYVRCAIGQASAYGINVETLYQIAMKAASSRDLDRLVEEAIEQRRQAA